MITSSQNVVGVDGLMGSVKPANTDVKDTGRDFASAIVGLSGEVESP
jgi:hypothetical protein